MLKKQIYEQSFSLIVLIITLNIFFEPIKCLSSELDKFGKNTVYVVNHGWHTGFVVNAYDIQEEIPELKQRFGSVPYIEFGWGDKEFYQADEITPDVTLKAIFLPTDSVLHAVAITSEADKYFNTRPEESKIAAWSSNQSSVLINREELNNVLEKVFDIPE